MASTSSNSRDISMLWPAQSCARAQRAMPAHAAPNCSSLGSWGPTCSFTLPGWTSSALGECFGSSYRELQLPLVRASAREARQLLQLVGIEGRTGHALLPHVQLASECAGTCRGYTAFTVWQEPRKCGCWVPGNGSGSTCAVVDGPPALTFATAHWLWSADALESHVLRAVHPLVPCSPGFRRLSRRLRRGLPVRAFASARRLHHWQLRRLHACTRTDTTHQHAIERQERL